MNTSPHAASTQTLISKVARFVACEMIEGDYLEFGVYRGAAFINSYQSLEWQFHDRIAQQTGGEAELESKARRERIWNNMRFFAFDSFQGLPVLAAEDRGTEDFKPGMYACSLDEFGQIVRSAGVPHERIIGVPGWFEDTCRPETAQRLGLTKASVVWIDCDLYSSTTSVLSFIGGLLQDGTVIVFDDWFTHRGSPFRGEQRAFAEWVKTPEIAERFVFHEYQREGWVRMSFIASERGG